LHNSVAEKYGWYNTLGVMSNDRFLDIEEITKKPIYESLTYLSWLKDKNAETVRTQRNRG